MVKRKKDGTFSRAEDVGTEGARNEASQEASSHENPSAYLTRDEMDGVLDELRTQMARQDDLLRKQQEMIDQFFARMEGRPSGNTQLAGNSTEIAPAAAANRIGSDPIRTEGQNLNSTQMEMGDIPHRIGSDPIRTATLHEPGGSSLPSGNQGFAPVRPTSAPVRVGNTTQIQHQAPQFGTGEPVRIGTSDPNRAPLHNLPRFSEPQQGGTSEPNRMTCQAPYTLPHSSELNAGGTSSGLVNLQQLFEGDRLANLIERLSRGRTYQNDMDDVNHNPFT